jgi:hypothetical protein
MYLVERVPLAKPGAHASQHWKQLLPLPTRICYGADIKFPVKVARGSGTYSGGWNTVIAILDPFVYVIS